MAYHEIKSLKDVPTFLLKTNSLHDGYIISASYQHQGYTWGNPLRIDPEKSKLVLNIVITSISNAQVELVFEGIKDLQIKEIDYELLDSSISFSDEFIVWCGDSSTDTNRLHDSNYVIAKRMKWRII